jgi:hypothetical protein
VPNTARELLDAAYSQLGFAEGDLASASTAPNEGTSKEWVNKGDWLSLAKKVGAEKIFFVNDYPVIVFAEQLSNDPTEWLKYFNSIWCMARPQMLFLARDGELSVFNLTKQPARTGENPTQHNRLLDVVRATTNVQEHLHRYRREQVESGRLFEDERFGFDDRADRALVRDLGHVRQTLVDAGLAAGYAHAVIGRSIFIRYLEDRHVLTEEYFRKIAKSEKNWTTLLDQAVKANVDLGGGQPVLYPYVLTNKAFTYALFTRLATEFNGDMFPFDHEEQKAVGEQHLKILHRFLLGGKDEKLFFFAYRFDIIPIELISNIYETFYSLDPQRQRDEGSFYTPSALVDFLLSDAMSESQLAKNPRVLDPACGSGIFLVEAFRRIVRYRVARDRRPLSSQELRDILRDQIAGIDISSEAIRVAAFSLYLAMLHYLDPPDILHHKLPCLSYATRSKTDPTRHFDILIAEDVFRISETISNKFVRARFLSDCADIVVGNPPWGSPQVNMPEDLRSDGGIKWCKDRNLSVGDKERSQTFIHRTMDILRSGGRAAMLVSTGVFFKRHAKTKKFRQQWLENITLRKVVNFAAVREAFFQNSSHTGDSQNKGAIAPFAAVIFDNYPADKDGRFTYWSAKETALVKRVQAVVLSLADIHSANQSDYERDDTLWKIYWWGGHRDEALIRRLRCESTLSRVFDPDNQMLQSGFKEVSRDKPSGWLKSFKEFPARRFERYGPLPTDEFVNAPTHVERRRKRCLYEGPRLLIKRGVTTDQVGSGTIIARFEKAPFCYRHSIYGLPIAKRDEVQAKITLGIIWSSLTRYYLFLTSGTWGLWHDEVLKDTLTSLPVRLPKASDISSSICAIVDELRNLPSAAVPGSLFSAAGIDPRKRLLSIKKLEKKLDDAIYDLFELSDAERERIDEVCSLGLELFSRGMNSKAVKPLSWPNHVSRFGNRQELDTKAAQKEYLCEYAKIFLDLWEPQLVDQDGRLRWRIVFPDEVSSMIAFVFETETADEPLPIPTNTDEQAWLELLMRLDKSSLQPTRAKRIYIDGLVRVVTDSQIVIIKRNECRLWTQSAARDDAEAVMVMAMQLAEDLIWKAH